MRTTSKQINEFKNQRPSSMLSLHKYYFARLCDVAEVDMLFLSYQVSLEQGILFPDRILQETEVLGKAEDEAALFLGRSRLIDTIIIES